MQDEILIWEGNPGCVTGVSRLNSSFRVAVLVREGDNTLVF